MGFIKNFHLKYIFSRLSIFQMWLKKSGYFLFKCRILGFKCAPDCLDVGWCVGEFDCGCVFAQLIVPAMGWMVMFCKGLNA